MVNSQDMKSFSRKEGLTPADDPDGQMGTTKVLVQYKKNLLLVLRWERPCKGLAHFEQRLANHLARGCGRK